MELVRSLGADHVIDYTKEDFSRAGEQYDVILDNVANRSLTDLRRVLKPKGKLVIVGAAPGDWIGPLVPVIKALLLSPFVDQQLGMIMGKREQRDMVVLAELMQAGKVTPVIDQRYPLTDVAEAMRYLETGRARGKVVVTIIPETQDAPRVTSSALSP